MQAIEDACAPIECLSEAPGHHFFGYYDLQPWSADGTRHLCHRVPFMDRLPQPDDRAEIGFIDTESKRFVAVDTTCAWNFQQGAMLQWQPRRPDDEILYNIRDANGFAGVSRRLSGGETQRYARPFANVSSDGRWALSVNFSRMLDFRPGYGYTGLPDPYLHSPAPDDDGVFLLDLENGREELILSLSTVADQLAGHFGEPFRGCKVLINHLTFNPSASRFLFLARTMAMPGTKAGGWMTLFASADRDGGNIHIFPGHGGASHYWWRDDRHILIYADLPGRGTMRLCLAEDQSDRHEVLDPELFSFDGHCSFSPNLRYILYDSYPDGNNYRKLLVYDVERRSGTLLAKLYSVEPESNDGRCDLHPRWHRNGTRISFDSTHESHRHVYTMDLSNILE